MDERDFGEAYYADDCGRPYGRDAHRLGFFARIADVIVSGIEPRRVLDAGCAMGLLVEALCERGVDAYGAITPWAVRYRRDAVPCHELVGRYEALLFGLRAERDAALASLAELAGERDALRWSVTAFEHRIAAMERSVFWNARAAVERAIRWAK